MANIEKQHEIVKTSLFKFVNEHISGADLSVVDEIVLAYVISILEEASQDPCFDVDGMWQPNGHSLTTVQIAIFFVPPQVSLKWCPHISRNFQESILRPCARGYFNWKTNCPA